MRLDPNIAPLERAICSKSTQCLFDVRFGSLAAPQDSNIPTAAFGCKADAETAGFHYFSGPLTAEAVSKRKITRAGGNYDLHFDWHVAKVGPVVLRAKDSLPMWCAVPVTSKTRLF